MKKLLLLTVAMFVAVSCSSVDKRHFKAVQFFNQNKDKLAELCYSEFPAKTEYIKGDTIRTTKTEVVEKLVDCPDGSKVECKEKTKHITETIIDTIKVVDTALEAKLRAEINKLNASNILMSEKIEDSLKQLKTANKENNKLEWIIKGLVAALVILTFLKLK